MLQKWLTLCVGTMIFPALIYPFDEQPWLGDVWEFNFSGEFTYSRYRKVQGAAVQLSAPSNDKLIQFDLGLTLSEKWDVQGEIQFADTPRQSLGLRSGALQGRILWMNDITGDLLSWATGLSLRGVSDHSLKDVSCPYHANVDMELNTALGKEWAQDTFWTTHLWGLAAIGMANRGSPWIRVLGVFEKNWDNHHRLAVFTEGYFGLGHRSRVNIKHFDGWGHFDHQSIDLGASYTYHFDFWGEISAAYTRRLFAHTFPENVNFFTVAYQVPFSFF